MCSVHPAFTLFQMTHLFWIRRAPGNLHTHRMGTHTNKYPQIPPNTPRMPITRALKYHSNAHHHNDDLDPQIPTFPMPRALPRLPTWPPIPTTTTQIRDHTYPQIPTFPMSRAMPRLQHDHQHPRIPPTYPHRPPNAYEQIIQIPFKCHCAIC